LQQGCCPFKILEGMAAGRPVLASSLPVVIELAGDDAALFLCKPGSSGSIADALINMRANPGQLVEMAVKARKRIETNYTLDLSSKLLCESYSELLSTRLSKSSS
ncbi:MAG: glycosyltransferase, partial [Candidatus Obscuribacterales bacterium]|nr:glycosyltransferase [Candidatus Obscuribacterales bacterium]